MLTGGRHSVFTRNAYNMASTMTTLYTQVRHFKGPHELHEPFLTGLKKDNICEGGSSQ